MGVLPEWSDPDRRAAALDRVLAAVIRARGPLPNEPGHRDQPARTRATLTGAELEVVRYLAHGLHEPDIARARWVSYETVRTQTKSIRAKLAAKTNAHAVAIALRQRLID